MIIFFLEVITFFCLFSKSMRFSSSSMIFLILIGASIFSVVFRGFGGDEAIHALLSDLPGGVFGAMLVVMVVVFVLGFILDFIEITFVVVPLVAPVLFMLYVPIISELCLNCYF